MHQESALIIFVRNPVKGNVKTRIAATTGDDYALAVYEMLLSHTRDITDPLPLTKFVFYADCVNGNDLWNGYEKVLQAGGDLGHRMRSAFDFIFKKGYKKGVIIGSDCFDLSSDLLNLSFSLLHTNEIVIGPATDGGYYLLGMQSPLKDVFKDKKWSSSSVFSDTLQTIDAFKYSLSVMEVLKDVDKENDIPDAIQSKLSELAKSK